MKRLFLALFCFVAAVNMIACDNGMDEAKLYLGQQPPGRTPEIFAPGIISTENYEHSPAVFSPDLKTVYWVNAESLDVSISPFERR